MGSTYDFFKWKFETEVEQRNKRKQFKFKHSTLHKLVSQGNIKDAMKTVIGDSEDEFSATAGQKTPTPLAADPTPAKSHKKISKKLRRLLKDPSISQDIIRYTPGSHIPFKLSDDGIWKSDTTIVANQLQDSPSQSDVNNVVSDRESSRSESDSLAAKVDTASHESLNKKSVKDKLYFWWLKNFAIHIDNLKVNQTEPIRFRKERKQSFKSIPTKAAKSRIRTEGGNWTSFHRFVTYGLASFSVLMAFKTLLMFVSSEKTELSVWEEQVFLSAINGFVILLALAHFTLFNSQDEFDIVNSVAYVVMTLGSCLNYGYFMYRQDCFNAGDLVEAECKWSLGFHKWFDLMITVGALFNVVYYYLELKQSTYSPFSV